MEPKEPISPRAELVPGGAHDLALGEVRARETTLSMLDVPAPTIASWSTAPAAPAAPAAQPLFSAEEAASLAPVLLALKGCDASDPRFETAEDPRIPAAQMYFKIGEVAKITGIKPYVLRYWEVEFPWIRPEKTSSRQRRYRRQDIALLFRIGRLRYEEQLTIDRTRQLIREDRKLATTPRTLTARGRAAVKARARPAPTALTARGSPKNEEPREGTLELERAGQLALTLTGVARSTQLSRALADMRKTVLELLEAVEE